MEIKKDIQKTILWCRLSYSVHLVFGTFKLFPCFLLCALDWVLSLPRRRERTLGTRLPPMLFYKLIDQFKL